MAAAVLLPGAVAQELPEVVPDCPSHVQQEQRAADHVEVTYDAGADAKRFSSSHEPLVAAEPGQPLNLAQRFDLFLHRTGSKANLSTVAVGTCYAFEDRPYGPGFPGYTKLYAAKFADSASRNFLHTVVLSHAFKQDPRFYRSTSTSTLGRFTDAASSVVITRTNDGRKTFNSSRVLATFLSAALSNAYYPAEERGFGQTMERGGRRLMLDVSSGVVREFAPDLLRKLFRRDKPDTTRDHIE
jgi:hypothetical protein